MRLAFAALVVLLTACSGQADAPTASPSSVPSPSSPTAAATITLVFQGSEGSVSLDAEVADSPPERARGLMDRESMGEDAGMLFAWPEDTTGAFWMRNTLIPLTVAFIRADGTIIHFEDMEPLTDDRHTSPEPYRYAVETNRGWFAENGIEAGSRVDLSGYVPAGQ